MLDNLTKGVKILLIINIVVFVIQNMSGLNDEISDVFALHNPIFNDEGLLANPYFKPWQLITHMFMHGGTLHIFFNMFGLATFGPILESYLGEKKFLIYYIICGLGAAVLQSGMGYYEMLNIPEGFLNNVLENGKMVGASGAIMGLLVAFGMFFPNVEMQLMFIPIPIKAKYMVILYGLYDLFMGTSGAQTGIAHFAHLGGLLTGFILIKFFGFRFTSRR
ncbi:MAG: rhomboid family intramembrane serine protease [Leadbetterella sp.]